MVIKIQIELGDRVIVMNLDEAKSLYDELHKMFGDKPIVNPYLPYPIIQPSQPIEPYYVSPVWSVTGESSC